MKIKLTKVLCISIFFSVTVLSTVLLASGVDPQQVEFCGTELMDATYTGNLEKLKLLLLEGKVDVNQTDKYGWSALMRAAWAGCSESVGLLLAYEADVNQKDKDGSSALIHAASPMSNLETVRLLLAHKAKVDEQDNDGRSALTNASYGGRLGVVEVLIANGADVNLRSKKDGATALMFAAINARLETVRLLLTNGAKANKRDHYGRTASSFALSSATGKTSSFSEKHYPEDVINTKIRWLEVVKLLRRSEKKEKKDKN